MQNGSCHADNQANSEKTPHGEARRACALDCHLTPSQHQNLFENSLDAVFLLDVRGRFVEANPAAQRLSGYPREQLCSMTFAELCSPEDRQKAMFFFARALHGAPRSVEITIRRRSGRAARLFVTGSPSRTDGKIAAILCIARDVTRENRVKDRLRHARDNAEQTKDRFLAMLSHELRTPLMPVLTAVQMLQTREELTPELHEMLGMMQRNLELEARLIDDLLDMSRIRRGKLTLYMRSTDVHAKIRQVVELCREEIHHKQLSLRLEFSAPLSHLSADSARVQQVLWNVISNAVKFTPAGGKISVRTCNGPSCSSAAVSCCLAGEGCAGQRCAENMRDFMAIHVIDSGIGIEAEQLDRLFDAFDHHDMEFKAGERRIRLTISRALVELHGGRLLAHSRGKGQGATFTVLLPLRKETVTINERHHVPITEHSNHGRRRVLLVEDHPDTARVLAHVLRARGYSVEIAPTVATAIATSRHRSFDLLLSDIGLPDGTGADVLRAIRAYCDMPAVAMSGYGMEEDIRRSHQAGFSDHLVKPINLRQLQETIERLLHPAGVSC